MGQWRGVGCWQYISQTHCVTWYSRRPDLIMRLLLAFLLLSVLLVLVCEAQRRPNRNNRGQLRAGRQQQQRGRNNRNNNNRNNNNKRNNNRNNGRRAKAGKCGGGNAPNHSYKGQNFLISWRLGCSKFTQSQAERFCKSNNMRAV